MSTRCECGHTPAWHHKGGKCLYGYDATSRGALGCQCEAFRQGEGE